MKKPIRRLTGLRSVAILTATLAAAVTFTGCSTFNHDWNAALKQPLPPNDISGPWEGRWISDSNGHNDKLRCLITPGSGKEYDANFHANYKTVFHFSYTVPLQVQKHGRSFIFSGSANLGKMAGGEYTYQGAATPTNFFSTYDSQYDHGKFELHRPEQK